MKSVFTILLISLPMVTTAMESVSEQSGQGQALIRFYGTSTLHDFSGQVNCEPFTWQITTDPNTGTLVVNGELDVLISKMDTQNKKRDKNMRNMFQSKKFPHIHGKIVDANLAAVQPIPAAPREVPGKLPIVLTISNKKQNVMAQVTQFKTTAEKTTFTLNFDVSLKSFGLKPPSVMGIIRVGDTVRLQAEVTLTPKQAQEEPSSQS